MTTCANPPATQQGLGGAETSPATRPDTLGGEDDTPGGSRSVAAATTAATVTARPQTAPTTSPASVAPSPSDLVAREQARHGRWNYLALALDGGFFMGAMTFLNAATVLPTIVKMLGGPPWLVSLMPNMMMFGFVIPQLLSAHHIERMRRYLPILLSTGIFQRAVYLLAGLALLFYAQRLPMLALAAVVLAPLLSGIFGGISSPAFSQLVIKTIPAQRRSSVFALRYIMGAMIGILASYIITRVLRDHPGTTGYGILHLWAFGTMALSWFTFACIREVDHHVTPAQANGGVIASLRLMPRLLLSNRQYVYLACFRGLRSGMGIILPFLAIHARHKLNASEDFLGQLAMVLMIGSVAGNLSAAYIGDHIGSKPAILLGTIPLIGLAIWSPLAGTSIEFQIIFFLLGFSQSASEVGNQALGLEVCPQENRSTYFAMLALLWLPTALAASWASKTLYAEGGSLTGVAAATAVCLTLSLLFLLPLRDPRRLRRP